jgi:4-alpha-glucanotransferase
MPRRAGVLVPLFSVPSTHSWGIGELADLVPLSRWLAAGGFNRLMILPLGTMAADQASPYSAVSAMAIDPIFIAVERVAEFQPDDRPESRQSLSDARSSTSIRYDLVRALKNHALDRAFDRFVVDEWEQLTTRAAALAAYIARERWWLDDYALFQAAARASGTTDWRTWPAPLRDRHSAALDEARRQLGREVLRQQYFQWTAETQWQQARETARGDGVSVIGDLPFVVGLESADVWARQQEFWLDVSAGAPPDAFTDEGQDWHLPTYDWQTIARTDYEWLRQRARRMAALFDGFRVDHLVGFYRTYGRPSVGKPFFTPSDEASQIRQGERILEVVRESGADLLAEDLGTVPDYVRASMARSGVPGSKVLRWERMWNEPGQPFIEPAMFPAVSVALTGTHDTEPLATWWESARLDERRAFTQLPSIGTDPDHPWTDGLRDRILAAAYGAGSDDLFLPIQDVFGWRDRINVPGTVSPTNWTWRLPWPVDHLMDVDDAVERAQRMRALALKTSRGTAR